MATALRCELKYSKNGMLLMSSITTTDTSIATIHVADTAIHSSKRFTNSAVPRSRRGIAMSLVANARSKRAPIHRERSTQAKESSMPVFSISRLRNNSAMRTMLKSTTHATVIHRIKRMGNGGDMRLRMLLILSI